MHPLSQVWMRLKSVISFNTPHQVAWIEEPSPLCLQTELHHVNADHTNYRLIPEDCPGIGVSEDGSRDRTDSDRHMKASDSVIASNSKVTMCEGHMQQNIVNGISEMSLMGNVTDDISSFLYGQTRNTETGHFLHSSLTELVIEKLTSDKMRMVIAKGAVYEKGLISADFSPINVHITGCINGMLMTLADSISCIIVWLTHIIGADWTVEPTPASVDAECHQNHVKYSINIINKCAESCTSQSNIQIGMIELQTSAQHHKLILFTINLDRLTCFLYGIKDAKLLWTSDDRYFRQFEHSLSPFHSQSVSQFPLSWVFDLSFWENPDKPFNELLFCDIFRDCAGDIIDSLTLIDRYHDPTSGQRSRCYRQVFRSCDGALSYTKSHDYQKYIRLKLAKEMGIILR